MHLSLICALTRNRAIGLRGDLLYHLPADLRHFKALTTGHTVLMGRRTFESLPKGALPNRRNVVISRQADYSAPGIDVYPSLEAALAACAADEEVFVIGGASVYEESLPLADRLCLTLIDDEPAEADTFFPDCDLSEWQEVEREAHPADERHAVPFAFVTYRRK